MRVAPWLLVVLGMGLATEAWTQPLELEAKIPLGDVHGRIDHLAIDVNRQRVFVAELGNDSVGVVDLRARKTVSTLIGLRQPQGVGYVPSTDTLYIANAGDGSVRLFQGEDLAPIGQIDLGEDADNVRVDDAAHRIYVGYGDGALAVIDTQSRSKIADIALNAHAESFQLEGSGQRIFINVPDRREIASVDRLTGKQIAAWPTNALRANFPLALDETHQTFLVVFRKPAKVGVFRVADGQLLSATDTCGDADDVFIDEKRSRVYVSCGEGFIDVMVRQAASYASLERIPTAAGARTGLYDSEVDRFILAVRSEGTTAAAIWVFRPGS